MFGIEKARKLPRGQALRKRAEDLGVSVFGVGGPFSENGYNEAALQQRVMEAERALREKRIWIFALLSACASVASAIAAIIAVIN